MYRIADLFTQSADQYLSRWFESDVIKAVLAYYASGIGTYAGPKSPGSAYVIMHHLMGEHEGAGGWGFVRGGMGAISRAIARSGARFGLEVRTEAEIAKVLIEEGRAVGVVTAPATELRARVVACNANAKILFFDLIEPRHLPADFLDELGRFRTFSTAFKINLACERPPHYRAFDGASAASPIRATSTSARTSSIWSGPTTTPSTAGTRPGRSSRRSCRPRSTTPSRRPASTSSICSAATPPIASRTPPGSTSAPTSSAT